MMADYIAVYGSLRRGMQAASKMERMEFVGQGTINASLYALGWYPGVKLGEGVTVVDVFKLSANKRLREAILYDLDGYEGYSEKNREGSLFIRTQTLVALEGREQEILAYVYEYNYPVNQAPLVKNGDWYEFSNATT